MAAKRQKSKIKQLIKKRETLIEKIKKDEIAYEEECIKRRKAIQDKQEELKETNQEIFSLIDNDQVTAFMKKFTLDFLEEKNQDGKMEEEKNKEANDFQNETYDTENVGNEQEPEVLQTPDTDDYAESFRKQYGL